MKFNIKKTVLSLTIAAVMAIPSLAMAEEIKIAVAANFQNAMTELIVEYGGGPNDVTITPVYDASGTFDAAIRGGNAPGYSLFFSADNIRPQNLVNDGYATNAQDYAIGQLAAYSTTSPLPSDTLSLIAWLQDSTFTSGAVANPSLAPYGVAAQEFLSNSTVNLWGDNRIDATYSNIGTAFAAADTGVKQVGFVAKAQTINASGYVATIDDVYYSPIIQSVCLVEVGGAINSEASAFLSWIQTYGPAGSIIGYWGYELP